uniref:Ig-like domain-containing protein n=1 Tax=Myripristis murdjan TaxID=586833 RepID=A0A668AIE5_9TELE
VPESHMKLLPSSDLTLIYCRLCLYTRSFKQFGYDGEDFIVLDMNTMTWIAPTPQAVFTKHKWDQDRAMIARQRHYYTQECVDWLKKYVDYGRSTLLRTELPSVSLLQKTPSSPVTCHASGFYPNKIMLFWRRDGEEVHEEVDHGEILHNHDGTFQKSVDLNVSSVKAEDWWKYSCVFQLSGVNEDIVTKLDPKVIKTNWAGLRSNVMEVGKTRLVYLTCSS